MSLARLMLTLAESMEQMALRSGPLYRRNNFYQSPFTLMERIQDEFLDSRRTLSPAAKIGKNGYQVSMDVSQFKPNELKVKVVDNNIVIEGEHEERENNDGYISRRFVQRYRVPKNYDADKVISSLSSDGILTVSVPNPTSIDKNSKGKIVQIQQTGPAHLNVKDNLPDEQNADSENKVK